MREAIGRFYAMDYLHDMLLLGLLFVPLGVRHRAGHRALRFQFEPHVRREAGPTDLLLAEPVTASAKAAGQTPARYRTRTLVRALLNIDAFRQALIARAERFHRAYPVLRRIGWVALVAQPLVTFAIMVLVHADVDTRVMMLMAMVVGVIVVDTYLIVISYLDTNLAHQLALAT